MPDAPSLRELQHELEILFSSGGKAGDASGLTRAVGTLPVAGDERLSPAERVGIYTEMIFLRIRDAIAEDFAATFAALGDDAWDQLIADYLDAHPTDDPDLRMAGRHLPGFLRATRAAPVADLAALEWALLDSFTAASAPLLCPEHLHALAPDDWLTLEVRAIPSTRILAASSPCDDARRRLLDGETVPLEVAAPVTIRLWRRDLRVFQKRTDAFEHAALERAIGGIPFADLCAWIAEERPDEDASQLAVKLLQGWLADELLSSPFPRGPH